MSRGNQRISGQIEGRQSRASQSGCELPGWAPETTSAQTGGSGLGSHLQKSSVPSASGERRRLPPLDRAVGAAHAVGRPQTLTALCQPREITARTNYKRVPLSNPRGGDAPDFELRSWRMV